MNMEDGYSSEQWDIIKTPSGEVYVRSLHSLKAISDALANGSSKLGLLPDIPSMRHERGIHWFKVVGTGLSDASSAANADTGAYNNITTYGTTEQDDVFIYLYGTFDFDGHVNGLQLTGNAYGVFGMGPGRTVITNTNVARVYCMTNGAGIGIEIAGFDYQGPAALTAYIYTAEDNTWVHHCFFYGGVTCGILIGTGGFDPLIEHNLFYLIGETGIRAATNVSQGTIRDNFIYSAGLEGILLGSNTVDHMWVHHNFIFGGTITEYGIEITLGDTNTITDNYIGGCTLGLILDTGTDNVREGNKGTWIWPSPVVLDGNEQDWFASAVAPSEPLNETGVMRIYIDYTGIGAGDTIVHRFYRANSGGPLVLARTITQAGVPVDLAPVYEERYSKYCFMHVTVQRTAGVLANIDGTTEVAVS